MGGHELDRLQQIHFEARAEFEKACRSDSLTKAEFDAIRQRSLDAAKDYHDCLARSWSVHA